MIADERIRAANEGFSYALLLRRAQKLATIDSMVESQSVFGKLQDVATPAATAVEPKPALVPDAEAC
jgi:hypothetical protein